MINRRRFTALLAGVATLPHASWARSRANKVVFYASVGPELSLYHVDVGDAALAKQSSVMAPANVQYVWRHPSARVLYVVSSNGGPGLAGDKHHASAWRIDPVTGSLQQHGPVAELRSRPIHTSVDKSGSYLLIAHNIPSDVTVLQLNQDATINHEIKQQHALDLGIFAHQIRVTPSNNAVILVTRGNDAANGKPEDPGALKVYGFHDGQLTNKASIAPGGGYGFGPRHLDFHPTRPWVYVSLERQNKLFVYKLRNDNLSVQPLFTKDTLAEPAKLRPNQLAGTVHVHPNGRFVYVANRPDAVSDFQGTKVDLGGENTIAVFAIAPGTGDLTLIQNADTRGFHPRTFSLDPSGRMMVAANLMPRAVRDGDQVKTLPATLATYRVDDDGKLAFTRTYDVETGGKMQFWSGMVALS